MKVRYGELEDNIYGEYNQANPNTMLLNRTLLGGGIEEAAKLAAVMAHEGEHALGTRIEALAHDRGSITYGTLAQMAAFNVDESFMMEMLMGMMLSENYAANTGDTDYWRLTREGNIIFDGLKDLYDEDGNLIKKYNGTGGYTASLADVLGIPEEAAKQMLINAGLTYTDGTFKTSEGVDAKNNYGVQIRFLDNIEEYMTINYQGIGSRKRIQMNQERENALNKNFPSQSQLVEETARETIQNNTIEYWLDNFWTVPGDDSLAFFGQIMNEDVMLAYSAKENNDKTQCARYVKETILKEYENGGGLHKLIFEGTDVDTNTMFGLFKENTNLERLNPFDLGGNDLNAGIAQIQELADSGVLILLIAQSDKYQGHIAFIGNSNLTLSTNYEETPLYNGMTGVELREQNPSHLIVVHAGVYPGITSILYTTNGYNTLSTRIDLLKNDIFFYAVRKQP